MKERKTTESNDPKKPLLIDTSLNGEFLVETSCRLGMGGKAFPPRGPAAVVVGMLCLHSPSVCTPQPTTITKSFYCFHWNTTTYMYKKSKPTSFSSVLIIRLSIKHQHQDIFSRTSSALAYSTQLAARKDFNTHKMNRFNFWSCTKKVSGKLKYQKSNLENTVLNFQQSLIV